MVALAPVCDLRLRPHLEQELLKLEEAVGEGLAAIEAAKKLTADARAEKCSVLSERLGRIQVLGLEAPDMPEQGTLTAIVSVFLEWQQQQILSFGGVGRGLPRTNPQT